MEEFWVSVQLSERTQANIERIYKLLRQELPEAFEPPEQSHLTILPGVQIPEKAIQEFYLVATKVASRLEPFTVDGIEYHPSEHPYVVLLNVTANFTDIRKELLTFV